MGKNMLRYQSSASKTLIACTVLLMTAGSSAAQTTLEPGQYEQIELSFTDNEALGDLHADTRGQLQTECLTPEMAANQTAMLEKMLSDAKSDNCSEATIEQDGNTTTLKNQCEVYGQTMHGQYTYVVESSTRYTVRAHMEGGPQPMTVTSAWSRVGDCNQ